MPPPNNDPRTLLEMAAGRRAVERASVSEEVRVLKKAGFKVTSAMSVEAIKVNYMLAAGANALPKEDRTYLCGICGHDHTRGERCPNSARKHVTDIWSKV